MSSSSSTTERLSLGVLADQSFAAVIFDMDGTLVDSTPAVRRSWTRWSVEHGISEEEMDKHHGVPAAAIVRLLIAEEGQEAAIDRINELELADVSDVVTLPGAVEALAALVDAPDAIATSCTAPLAAARIAASGLAAPSVVVTADSVAHGKPAPDPYLEAARRLGVDPTDCLVVEDAPAGLTSARAAGCRTLAIVTTNPREVLEADAVVGTLADVRFSVTDGRITVALA